MQEVHHADEDRKSESANPSEGTACAEACLHEEQWADGAAGHRPHGRCGKRGRQEQAHHAHKIGMRSSPLGPFFCFQAIPVLIQPW